MKDDGQFLREYLEDGCQSAFTALVRRHTRLVYNVAYRQVEETSLAEDITQRVFVALDAKAKRLRGRTTLAPWLHRAALLEASSVKRAERRRQRREAIAAAQSERELMKEEPVSTSQAMLDELISKLAERDRELLLLRFYEGRSIPSIAELTGHSVAALQKRSSRLLARLRKGLELRGHGVSMAVLVGSLTNQLEASAPQAVIERIAASSSDIAREGLASTGQTVSTRWLAASAALLGAAGILISLVVENHRLRASLALEETNASRQNSNASLLSSRGSGESMDRRSTLSSLRVAMERFAARPDLIERRLRIFWAIEHLSPDDLPGAAEMALSVREIRSKGFVSKIFKRWASVDLDAALSMAVTREARRTLTRMGGGLEDDALDGVCQALTEFDPNSWPDRINSLDLTRPEMGMARARIYRTLAWSDPAAARNLAMDMEDVSVHRVPLSLYRLARKDPESALAEVGSYPNRRSQKRFVRSVIKTTARKDVPLARDLAERITLPELQEEAYGSIASHLSGKDFDEAFSVAVDHVTLDRVSGDVFQNLGQECYRQGGLALVREYSERLSSVFERSRFLGYALSMSAKDGLELTGTLSETLAPGLVRQEYVGSLGSRLAEPEYDDIAGSWLDALEPEDRDAALASYTATLSRRHPEEALQWIGGMGDDSQRAMSLRIMMRDMMKRDRASALAFLATPGIPVAERDYWRNR